MNKCTWFFSNWFAKDKRNAEEINRVIEYYSQRLMKEQIEYQKNTKEVFEKMYIYRDKLIENGIDLPE